MKQSAITKIGIMLIALIISLPFTFAAEMSLTYDLNGNLVTGDGKFRVYNSLNQLSKIYNGSSASGYLIQEYVYHPVEERVWLKKTYNTTGALIETVFYFNQENVQVKNLTGNYSFTYIYHEGSLIAQKNPDGNIIYIHSDSKGSATVVTNSTQAVIENTSYTGFGEIIIGGTKTRYEYESKEYDSVVGDTDFNFRKYSPQYGIFTQPDTIIPNVYDPQSLNRYAFERNSPYNKIDPTGHCPQCVAGGIGVILNIANYYVTHETYTARGVISYAVGGAISGSLGITGPFGSFIGGGASKVLENIGDKKQDITEGIFEEALFSAVTFGLGKTAESLKLIPPSTLGNIKKPLSLITTKTGLNFIMNQILTQYGSDVLKLGVELDSKNQRKGGSGSSANDISHAGEAGNNYAKITRANGNIEYKRIIK